MIIDQFMINELYLFILHQEDDYAIFYYYIIFTFVIQFVIYMQYENS